MKIKIKNYCHLLRLRMTALERSTADCFMLLLLLGFLALIASCFIPAQCPPSSLAFYKQILCPSSCLSVEEIAQGNNKTYDCRSMECALCNHAKGDVVFRHIFGAQKRFGTDEFCINTMDIRKLHFSCPVLNKRNSNVSLPPTAHLLLKSVVLLC